MLKLKKGLAYVWSDLHLGHEKILKFSAGWRTGNTIGEHDDHLEKTYLETVQNDDCVVFFLGDVSFSLDGLKRIARWPGKKYLLRGNHDDQDETIYRDIFLGIYGILAQQINGEYFWLSHAPVHPEELRNKRNIHGHIHTNKLADNPQINGKPAYINVSIESTRGRLVDLFELQSGKWSPKF